MYTAEPVQIYTCTCTLLTEQCTVCTCSATKKFKKRGENAVFKKNAEKNAAAESQFSPGTECMRPIQNVCDPIQNVCGPFRMYGTYSTCVQPILIVYSPSAKNSEVVKFKHPVALRNRILDFGLNPQIKRVNDLHALQGEADKVTIFGISSTAIVVT